MFTQIHFIGKEKCLTLDLQENERFKNDYESFLSTGKQADNQPYRLNKSSEQVYIYFPAIAYIRTGVSPPKGDSYTEVSTW